MLKARPQVLSGFDPDAPSACSHVIPKYPYVFWLPYQRTDYCDEHRRHSRPFAADFDIESLTVRCRGVGTSSAI
jgi:hypothetical protein